MPGVPDSYQGTDLPDYSLVDPDNRRPVDYAARERALAAGSAPKLALLAEILALRRDHAGVFADGSYHPLPVSGESADRVVAFLRVAGDTRLLVAVALRVPADGWGDAAVTVDDMAMPLATVFADRTVVVRPLWTVCGV